MTAEPEDIVRRFLFEELDIRGAVVRLTGAWREMCEGRDYPSAVQRLLGELTAVAVLIGCNLKQPGRLTLQIRGHGPVRLLVIDCTVSLGIRGMAMFAAHVPDLPAPALLGDGRLVLTLRSDIAAQPYQSIVPLQGGTVAAVFEHYLAQSEQQPARLFLHAAGEYATGLFIQKLPGADARDPDGWARVESLAATVTGAELAALPSEALLTRLFPEELLRVFRAKPVTYDCPEDWDKVRNMLRALGRAEVEAILRDQGEVVVRDDICNRTYRLGADDVAALFAGGAPPAGGTIH